MPSPIKFNIFCQDAQSVIEVSGYVNKRKDSLAMFKKPDGTWSVIHRASGNTISTAISADVTGYPKHLALMQHVQENAGESLQILDRMSLGEKARSPEMVTAALNMVGVIQSFKC